MYAPLFIVYILSIDTFLQNETARMRRCEYSRHYFRIIIRFQTEMIQKDLNYSTCSINICSYSSILAHSPIGYNVTIQAGNDVGLSSPVTVQVYTAKEMQATNEMKTLNSKYKVIGFDRQICIYVTVYRKTGHNAAPFEKIFFALTELSASRH